MRKSLFMDWRYFLCLYGIAAGNVISIFLINDLFPHPSASHPNQMGNFYGPICGLQSAVNPSHSGKTNLKTA